MSGGIGSGHGMVPFDDDVSAIYTFFSEPVFQLPPDCAAQPHVSLLRTIHSQLGIQRLFVGFFAGCCNRSLAFYTIQVLNGWFYVITTWLKLLFDGGRE